MKLIFLNAFYSGKAFELNQFIKQHANNTDIFCFQEAREKFTQLNIQDLHNHQLISAIKWLDSRSKYHIQTYVHQDYQILTTQIIEPSDITVGLGVYNQIDLNHQVIHLFNIHGLAHPGHKLDTPQRLQLSDSILRVAQSCQGPVIIGGDFNLLLDTRSVQMFADAGFRHLIKDFDIKTTRNRLAWEKWPDSPQYHADYIFTSSDIQVKDFQVPNIEISDHLPLLLEIDF